VLSLTPRTIWLLCLGCLHHCPRRSVFYLLEAGGRLSPDLRSWPLCVEPCVCGAVVLSATHKSLCSHRRGDTQRAFGGLTLSKPVSVWERCWVCSALGCWVWRDSSKALYRHRIRNKSGFITLLKRKYSVSSQGITQSYTQSWWGAAVCAIFAIYTRSYYTSNWCII